MELADMPTKFQHSLQKSNSHINIIINQLGTPKFTQHHLTQLDSTRATNVLLHRKELQHLWAKFMGKLLIDPW